MIQTVAVAISGGLDSLMAAYLLKKQGFSVVGIHFLTGYESTSAFEREDKLHSRRVKVLYKSAEKKIETVSQKLGITVHIVDLRHEFKNQVVNYFIQTYRSGKTPNPCLVCNPAIKFGTLLSHAQEIGATKLATGHYARLICDNKGICHLLEGLDSNKDQSYFLSFLDQDQLQKVLFPLGALSKNDVRALADRKGLIPFSNGESQDVCFIKTNSCREFLGETISPKPGPILDLSGNFIGYHQGLHLFTIGQRRGINCPASEPYYVIKLDIERNALIVGFKKDLCRTACRVENVNWIQQPPDKGLTVRTRLRYRHRAVPSTIYPDDDKQHLTLTFDTPQSAVAPGQGAVFYLGREVIGAGWIV